MNRRALRPVLASVFAFIVFVAVNARPGAVGTAGADRRSARRHGGDRDRFLGRDVDGRIDIVIERWSPEEQAGLIRTSLDSGPPKLLAALQLVQRRAGFVLSPGIQGTGSRARLRRSRNIQFAHEIKTPGGRQVVVATDQHLGSRGASQHGADRARSGVHADRHQVRSKRNRYRQDRDGAPTIAYNAEKQIIELENFGKLPERLIGVKSESWPQKY